MGKKKPRPEAVEIPYNLFDLPTAQHKAGLAGLIFAIRSLKERSAKDPEAIPPESVPEITEGPDDSGVKIRFTPRSVKGLFDDLYDADLVESDPREKPRTKGKGAAKMIIPPIKMLPLTVVDKKSGKEKQVEGYVYLDVTPRLAALGPLFPAIPHWLKLWRNVLFQAIRDSRKQAPYRKRAAERFKNSPVADAVVGAEEESDAPDEEAAGRGDGSSWDEVVDFRQGKLSSALYIGAQGVNAEQIMFTGNTRFNMLLHFWPLCVLVFVPSFIDSDGKEHLGKRSEKDKSSHYVITVPEVSSLRRFCELYPRMLSRLGEDKRGYRPARSVIAAPAQGSLEFINHIAQLAEQETAGLFSRALNSVEFYHLMKPEANRAAVVVGTGRVSDDPDLIQGYREIVGRPGEPSCYRNPLLKTALIFALLRGKPWWGEILPLFMNRDARFFVPGDDTPADMARLRWLWSDDVRKRLKLDVDRYQDRRRSYMQKSKSDPQSPPDGEPPPLTALINRLVRNYVNARAQERAGIDLDKFKEGEGQNRRVNWDRVPPEFGKERAKVAQSLFLEFRSRRDQAFVAHFAQTFFAVPQYMSETDRDQEQIAQALLYDRRIDEVKTLTLMALSAASWAPQRQNEKGTEE